ncbi:MAG: helix-turn-helix domain-containing protein [Thioalkalivibrio sp.]|nr:helix-turn-helix domain-containing protein [Thioalkalivibrio sp.]
MALLAPVSGRRLSVDQVEELVRLARQGVDYRQVAERVSCALSTVYALVGPAILQREDHRSLLHLSLADREEIRAGVEHRESLRAIARLLNRSVSTISREIERNGGRDAYRAWRAGERALQASRRPREAKIEANTELRRVIEAKMRKRWSPEQIAQHLRRTYQQ